MITLVVEGHMSILFCWCSNHNELSFSFHRESNVSLCEPVCSFPRHSAALNSYHVFIVFIIIYLLGYRLGVFNNDLAMRAISKYNNRMLCNQRFLSFLLLYIFLSLRSICII